MTGRVRNLVLFNLAIDSKLRGGVLVRLQVEDLAAAGSVRERGMVVQKKAGRPVQFGITQNTAASGSAWIAKASLKPGDRLFPSRVS
ncbi:hypothetical protein [Parvularcula maris]|uniref:Uncharacterized protein n=1 Tax=Parvularcula maris TaxID=2965077 RepID=A0A9X2LBU0_9PROT|nr:hypothetical protein [Parvularcula maris]MCQ8186641.1 hypothetical protein [Parvularcula maris]